MPRNSAGQYTPPAGNPVVTQTTVTSTWANLLVADLGTEIASSLDRSGRGGMLAPLKGVDGSVSAPAFSFTSESGTGFYRAGAGGLSAAILGAVVLALTDTAITLGLATTIADDLVVTGQVTAEDGTAAGHLVTKSQLDAVAAVAASKLTASLVSAFMLTVLDDADAATARGTLGTDVYKTLPVRDTGLATGELTEDVSGFTINEGTKDQCFSFFNNGSSSITITQGSGVTLRWAGTTLTGNRTLTGYGWVSWVYITPTLVVINGAGLS